ncbi:uncharacterized protein LOC124305054 isoform X1 [Neodiprion virginianus]|uniref:uncharacterized protein LOC124305054 isoform X1 n=1 Tax=Neodiprion virginianus TaxID=2961670 RepID=UPI001EE7021B|nr:uncharacterized protein LOC124305054 isoform X1 [Neodiprion virginianus]
MNRQTLHYGVKRVSAGLPPPCEVHPGIKLYTTSIRIHNSNCNISTSQRSDARNIYQFFRWVCLIAGIFHGADKLKKLKLIEEPLQTQAKIANEHRQKRLAQEKAIAAKENRARLTRIVKLAEAEIAALNVTTDDGNKTPK